MSSPRRNLNSIYKSIQAVQKIKPPDNRRGSYYYH